MPTIFTNATAAGDIVLNSGPGQGGGDATGPGCLVIDAIVGQIGANAVTTGTLFGLVFSDSNGTVFSLKLPPSANTTTAVPINLIFPNGCGPRSYGDTPTFSAVDVAGTAIDSSDIWISYHYE